MVDGVNVQAMIMAPDADADAARNAAEEAMAEYARVVRLVAGPDGAVDRLQREAGVAPISVAPEVMEMLQEAVRVCGLSDGAYDPTAAAYEALWPFGTPQPLQSPPLEELARRTPMVDCRQVALDPVARTALLKTPGMRVDLGEAARGLGLDRAMKLLQARGYGDALLYADGDVVISGHKAGRRWMVGIQDPRGSGHFAALPASNGAMFTVGDYQDSFMERGRRMHRVLEARTGMPARGVRSMTVVARTGLEAALLAHAAFVMGPDGGLRLVERLPSADAVMVDDRNRVVATKRLASALKYRPPTDAP